MEKLYAHLSEQAKAGRLSAKGMITQTNFKLKNETSFSLYIRPKIGEPETVDTLIDCRLSHEAGMSPAPIRYNEWSPLNIVELVITEDVLLTNDVFWATGGEAELL